jgi:hypothetical protein
MNALIKPKAIACRFIPTRNITGRRRRATEFCEVAGPDHAARRRFRFWFGRGGSPRLQGGLEAAASGGTAAPQACMPRRLKVATVAASRTNYHRLEDKAIHQRCTYDEVERVTLPLLSSVKRFGFGAKGRQVRDPRSRCLRSKDRERALV